jgi:hypothetical protein
MMLLCTFNKFLNEDRYCSSHLGRSNGNHGTDIKIVGNVLKCFISLRGVIVET